MAFGVFDLRLFVMVTLFLARSLPDNWSAGLLPLRIATSDATHADHDEKVLMVARY